MEGNLKNMKNIYKIMKEKGMEEDIKEWRYYSNYTVLIRAARSGSEDVLRWLLNELKLDVNKQNSNGDIALHSAAFCNQMESARLLLDAGSLQKKNRFGDTPLDDAKRRGFKEMQVLIESHFQLA